MNPLDLNLNTAHLQSSQAKLDRLGNDYRNPQGQDRQKLKQTAQDFEAILVQQLLDAMDKTVDRENSILGGGSAEDYFRSMLNEEIAKSITHRTGGSGFGLAEAIYQQMAKHVPPAPVETSEVKP